MSLQAFLLEQGKRSIDQSQRTDAALNRVRYKDNTMTKNINRLIQSANTHTASLDKKYINCINGFNIEKISNTEDSSKVSSFAFRICEKWRKQEKEETSTVCENYSIQPGRTDTLSPRSV